VIAADTENVSACRVNSSRTRFSWFSMLAFFPVPTLGEARLRHRDELHHFPSA
jgi:hypothetical protein